MIVAMRTRWLTIVAVTALAGCGTTPAHPPVARPDVSIPAASPVASPAASTLVPTPSPTCLTSGVIMSVGEVDAAMGLRAVGVTLRNCGTTVYRLNGYPDITVLDADQKVLDVKVLDGTSNVAIIERYDGVQPKRVDVRPGGTAFVVLVWRNLTTDAEKVAKGAYLTVTPSPGGPSQTLPLLTDPGNTGKMGVSPWLTG
jgi:hypothetical protein